MQPGKSSEIKNPYVQHELAEHYSSLLDFTGTYSLAVRDLPRLLDRHANGKRALDFACGAGRSTRYLKSLGFAVTGIDISQEMLSHALRLDPKGEYLLIGDSPGAALGDRRFDLILSAFPLASIPTHERLIALLAELRMLLSANGCIVVIEPTPEIYRCETLSFTTKRFPGNQNAISGDTVSIAFRNLPDIPVIDILWTIEDYQKVFQEAQLKPVETLYPRGRADDNEDWISECHTAPWVLYALKACDYGRKKMPDQNPSALKGAKKAI